MGGVGVSCLVLKTGAGSIISGSNSSHALLEYNTVIIRNIGEGGGFGI